MSDRLRVGLLRAGFILSPLADEHGDYPEQYAAMLAPFDVELTPYDVVDGPVPRSPGDQDAWLVSGSISSAYEDLPWIGRLEGFLRDVMDARASLVAVCFGHQVLAHAMGATVEKAEAGWALGVETYDLVGPPQPWMDPPAAGPLRIVASHQDQVTTLPDGAEVWLRTDHCPVAGYTLGDNALTIQPHPEFTTAFAGELVRLRRHIIGDDHADRSEADLDGPLDSPVVARWIDTFLRTRS